MTELTTPLDKCAYSDETWNTIELVSQACLATNVSFMIIDLKKNCVVRKSPRLLYVVDADGDGRNPYLSLTDYHNKRYISDIRKKVTETKRRMKPVKECLMTFPIMLKRNKVFITQRFTPLEVKEKAQSLLLVTIRSSAKKKTACCIKCSDGKTMVYDCDKLCFRCFKGLPALQERDRYILDRTEAGLSNHEIAEELLTSVETVKKRKRCICREYGVRNIEEAILLRKNLNS